MKINFSTAARLLHELTILLWNNKDPEPKSAVKLNSPSSGTHHLSTDRSGRWLVAVSFDGKATLYDLDNLAGENGGSGRLLFEDVWAVAIEPNARHVVASQITGDIAVWDISAITEETPDQTTESAASQPQIKRIQKFSGNGGVLGLSVDFASNEEHVAAGFESGAIHVYNYKTGRLEYSLTGHSNPIRTVKFSPAATLLAIGGDSKLISLYSMTSGEHITNLTGSDGWVFGLDWNETGEFLLSASYDGRSRVWWLESRQCVAAQNDSSQPLFGCKWLKKGWGVGVIGGINQGFATVGVDKTLRWYREAAGN
ncbi:SKI complex subunit WD repeat protein SKI8 [Sugiyamaella lignohabitans]|uniref:SKI complex subunit WD repeat protein SKI8 n=1 Tax=Sugiyamaella lignohabitans TaxID=796027 RepID=A0A167EF90_9ASCO|nr:SKI complex subunit WD repeat protein SKI8 [Sugiyamaella lignohabitans]ANB14002.1 SKI complex subunit WD repeat protein SKI8 [Sugiyamaella lignohabitans]